MVTPVEITSRSHIRTLGLREIWSYTYQSKIVLSLTFILSLFLSLVCPFSLPRSLPFTQSLSFSLHNTLTYLRSVTSTARVLRITDLKKILSKIHPWKNLKPTNGQLLGRRWNVSRVSCMCVCMYACPCIGEYGISYKCTCQLWFTVWYSSLARHIADTPHNQLRLLLSREGGSVRCYYKVYLGS